MAEVIMQQAPPMPGMKASQSVPSKPISDGILDDVTKLKKMETDTSASRVSASRGDDKENIPPKKVIRKVKTVRVASNPSLKKTGLPELQRTKSCPEIMYDDCREFDSFAGEWIDSKNQTVLISPWGVIRYPNNPKLRFEAIYMGPNHLSVTFDKDPKRRKFVGKLNHECQLLIWSNDTKWAKKGSKYDPRFTSNGNGKVDTASKKAKGRNGSCLIQ